MDADDGDKRKVKELGHLICGKLHIIEGSESLVFSKNNQILFIKEIKKMTLQSGYTRINISYTQTMDEKEKNIPPLLVIFAQEQPRPGEVSQVSGELEEAGPNDPFAKNFSAAIIVPAAEKIFGNKVKFIIGS